MLLFLHYFVISQVLNKVMVLYCIVSYTGPCQVSFGGGGVPVLRVGYAALRSSSDIISGSTSTLYLDQTAETDTLFQTR